MPLLGTKLEIHRSSIFIVFFLRKKNYAILYFVLLIMSIMY